MCIKEDPLMMFCLLSGWHPDPSVSAHLKDPPLQKKTYCSILMHEKELPTNQQIPPNPINKSSSERKENTRHFSFFQLSTSITFQLEFPITFMPWLTDASDPSESMHQSALKTGGSMNQIIVEYLSSNPLEDNISPAHS